MSISGNCDGDVEGPLLRVAVGDAWVHNVIFCGEGQTEGATWSATLQQGLIQR